MRILIRILALLFLLVLASIFYLRTFGFPGWFVKEFAERSSSGSFVLEAGAIKLDRICCFIVDNARLYRKRTIGPPVVDAGRVVVTIDPFAFLRKQSCLSKIRICNGIFRPFMARGPAQMRRAEFRKTRVRLELDDCRLQGVNVEKLSCNLRADGSVLWCENIKGALSNENLRGDIRGHMTYNRGTRILQGHVVTLFDPNLLRPVFEAYNASATVKLFKRFEFTEAVPECEMEFRKLCVNNGHFNLEGKFHTGGCRYRGVDVLMADGRVSLHFSQTNSTTTVDPLLVARHEGIVEGGFTTDTRRKLVEFDAASSINPKALARILGLHTESFEKDWRFKGPVKIAAKGIVDYGDRTQTEFEATVDGRDMGLLKFVADKCSFAMRMSGPTNTLSDVRGRIYGGEFTGSAGFVLPSGSVTNTRYMVDGKIRDADFGKFTKAVMEDAQKDCKGRLSGHVKIEGLMGTGNMATATATATGEGSIRIKDGQVFMLSVFGGLSEYLTKIVPGLDFVLQQSGAKADFTISDGKVHSDKVSIMGDILSLSGHGDYYFNRNVDFDVQVTFLKPHTLLHKIIRIPTYLISRLFEFRLRGTFDDPKWSIFNFPKDLIDKLGEKLGLKKPDDRSQGAEE